ncbi:MAG: GIN domain-containing protein [Flammeovirgaceae bacterium]
MCWVDSFVLRNPARTPSPKTIAGSGNITIAVSGSLNANIVGSGNIYYQGNPADIVVNVTGSGKVIKL